MIEKILSRLLEEKINAQKYRGEKLKQNDYVEANVAHGKIQTLKKVEEIVQEVAKEYGNGWIPVEERLPNIGERVLLFVYGRVHIGKRTDSKSYEHDIFSLENKTLESTRRIEAWMPLPSAPYQKGE